MAAISGARGSVSDGVGDSSRVGTVRGEFASWAVLPRERVSREPLLLSLRSRHSAPEPGRWFPGGPAASGTAEG